LYQVADLVLIPSIYENSPYAGFEAMAAGRPIVATAVGGLAEIIQDNVTGLLVPVHRRNEGSHTVDVGRLITAQLEMLNERKHAERMGKNGQQRLIKEFSLEKMVSSTLNVYRQVVRGYTESAF
jgi:alpha-maltose-1-phosphate synthase